MKSIYSNTSLETLCGLFGKSRQAWYDHQGRHDSQRLAEEILMEKVRLIRRHLPRAGGLKLLCMLREDIHAHGFHIGRDAFFAMLKRHGLLVETKTRYVRTTNAMHHYRKWPDLIQRSPSTLAEQVWVSDITYLRTEKGFIYLFLITDAFSRKIVGYHLSQSLKAQGCVIALEKAINARLYPQRMLIHHSDRGIQYCCDEYVSLLHQHGIRISMTQTGSPYDNAIAERVNGILKTEFALAETFKSYADAAGPVCKAISAYNQLRPHMSCQMHTPEHRHSQENTKQI